MLTVTEPQVWTIIAVLAAAFASFVGLTINLLGRTLTAQLGRITDRIDVIDRRIEALDKDVQAIAARVFPDNGGRPS